MQAKVSHGKEDNRLTACPRILRTRVPVLAIEAKHEKVEVGIESDTR